jgi:hypothetical protein
VTVVVSMGASALAAPIFTDTSITGEASVLNTGAFVVANNLGASPASTTINGILFGIDQSAMAGGGNGFGDFSTHFAAGSPLDIVLSSVRQGNITLTLSGLSVGTPYRLQLLMADNVQTPLAARQFDVTIQGSTFRESVPKTADGAKNLIIDFTPTASSTPVVWNNGNDQPILNSYVLHVVPEPSSLAFGLAAGVGILVRRTRRKPSRHALPNSAEMRL